MDIRNEEEIASIIKGIEPKTQDEKKLDHPKHKLWEACVKRDREHGKQTVK